MRYLSDRPCPDDNVRTVAKDWRDKRSDVLRTVLIVAIGVDDDVGTGAQGRFDAGAECVAEPASLRQSHDMRDAMGTCDFSRTVRASVVDDKQLDAIESVELAGQCGKRGG
jgi:hypothetical protein